MERLERRLSQIIMVLVLIQGVCAIYNYGFIGQDYNIHLGKIFAHGRGFSYADTNPPLLYDIGYFFYIHVGARFLECTSFTLLLLNIAALELVFRLLPVFIESPFGRIAAFLVLAFLPVREITSTVIASDALTPFFFFWVAWIALKIWRESSAWGAFKLWIYMSGVLCLALYAKFTFVGLIPALALVFAHRIFKRYSRRLAGFAVLALAIPSSYFSYQMWESYQAKSVTTHIHWKARGVQSAMDWSDLLLPKLRDAELLRAPEYFKDSILENHKYSYFGLSHLGIFTDTMDWWQTPTAGTPLSWSQRTMSYVGRERTLITRMFNRVAVQLGLPLSLLMLIGIAAACARGASAEVKIMLALAMGCFLPMFLSMPFVANAYYWGYWLPRLVLPSMMVFVVLAFRAIDQFANRQISEMVSVFALLYAAGLSVAFVLAL